jgi:hypothetical protein
MFYCRTFFKKKILFFYVMFQVIQHHMSMMKGFNTYDQAL